MLHAPLVAPNNTEFRVNQSLSYIALRAALEINDLAHDKTSSTRYVSLLRDRLEACPEVGENSCRMLVDPENVEAIRKTVDQFFGVKSETVSDLSNAFLHLVGQLKDSVGSGPKDAAQLQKLFDACLTLQQALEMQQEVAELPEPDDAYFRIS